jgi:thioredoxin 1
MDKSIKFAVVAALGLALGGVIALKNTTVARPPAENSVAIRDASPPPGLPAAVQPLPRLVDLGADKCVPCRAMAPILDGLRQEYQGRFDVEFIDVWQHREAGERYGIRVIPTQIFLDAQGIELFRHEGFYSRDEILGKWRELGFEFATGASTGAGS